MILQTSAIVTLFFGIIIAIFIGCVISYYMFMEEEMNKEIIPSKCWSTLSSSKSKGDDVGDQFLDEVGPSLLYSSESILDLAMSSGLAGEKFASEFKKVPSWVNQNLIKEGAEFQRRWINECFACGLASIVESYGYGNGAQILVETGRLACGVDAPKRLLETGIFSLDVIEYGIESGSKGLETICRVRMLHCMVRKHIRQACPWWREDSMGVPVSQEDGVHTLFLNSHVTMRGLEFQGIRITARERDAVSMFWSYVGYLLGIDEIFLPKSYLEEKYLYQTFFEHCFSPTTDTKTLIHATVSATSKIPPYYFSYSTVLAILRFTLGDEVSDLLDIEKPTKTWSNALVLAVMQHTAACKYMIYAYTGFAVNNIPFIRKNLQQGLRQFGIESGNAKFRFKISRKIVK